MANKNTMRKKREVYKATVAATGNPPQYIKPPKGHKAKVARKKLRRGETEPEQAVVAAGIHEVDEAMRVAIP